MPGKHWTRDERRSLRQQIAADVAPHDIVVENRSWAGICYMLRALHVPWSRRWTLSQTRSLIAQIKQGKKLAELRISDCIIGPAGSCVKQVRCHYATLDQTHDVIRI